MNKEDVLNANQLRTLLDYDPETGYFIWKKNRGRTAVVGAKAGHLHKPTGYIHIWVNRRLYKAHRLAWLHAYGEWPPMRVDHINRDKTDNRVCNLRLVTATESCHNRDSGRVQNASGYRGAHIDYKSGRYRARIEVNKRRIYLGFFDDPRDAHKAYKNARAIYHPAYTAIDESDSVQDQTTPSTDARSLEALL